MYTGKRYALIVGHRVTVDQVKAYLPSNYKVIWSGKWEAYEGAPTTREKEPAVVIEGKDNGGWTLHQYVLPRLGSGMLVGQEIDLSHPIMKEIPA